MSIHLAIQEITHDNLSGSQDIASKASHLILHLTRDRKHTSPEALRRDLLKVGRRLLHAQPAMASLLNLFNTVLSALNDLPNGSTGVREIRFTTKAFIREMNEHNEAISNHLFRQVRTKDTILTYSGSRSVREALLRCWKKDKLFSVICSESRPACEGSVLARRLIAQGIPTSLTTDALALSLLTSSHSSNGGINMILVGADSVSPWGIINKAGTQPLALVAHQTSVPLYCLAGSEKFFPGNFPVDRIILDAPRGEILAHAPRNLKIINRTFDVTPLVKVTGIITEKGLYTPQEMRTYLKKLHIHQGLMAALKKVYTK